jgi:hypothetical protein
MTQNLAAYEGTPDAGTDIKKPPSITLTFSLLYTESQYIYSLPCITFTRCG